MSSDEAGKQGTLESSLDSGVGCIQFAHPKGNSLPGALLKQLATQIDEFGNDQSVKVVVIQSAGERAFCAGASFDEFLAVSNLEESKDFFGGFARVILAIRRCPKFVVVRVQGKVVGGGVGIAAAADYSVATNAAAAKLSELALGIGPFIIGPAVQRKIGLPMYGAMGIDTEWKDAEWCRAHGLYSKLVDDISELDNAVNELTTRLSKTNTVAMQHLKRVLWEGTENWEELLKERVGVTAELALTDFVQNTIKSIQA